jgi:hypothetical protein
MMPKHLGRPQAGDRRSTTSEGEDDAKASGGAQAGNRKSTTGEGKDDAETSRTTAGWRLKMHNM